MKTIICGTLIFLMQLSFAGTFTVQNSTGKDLGDCKIAINYSTGNDIIPVDAQNITIPTASAHTLDLSAMNGPFVQAFLSCKFNGVAFIFNQIPLSGTIDYYFTTMALVQPPMIFPAADTDTKLNILGYDSECNPDKKMLGAYYFNSGGQDYRAKLLWKSL